MGSTGNKSEWFAAEGGLRFACTMCGNCCSGPEGYVLVSDEECRALAARLGLEVAAFTAKYTHTTSEGRSLKEVPSPIEGKGLDCIFLDRATLPGKAVCSVYEDRPRQCQTWPFWPTVIKSRQTWERAKRTCPGMDTGKLIPVEQVRLRRDSFEI